MQDVSAMAKRTNTIGTTRIVAVIKHAEWQAAHEAGQTSNGRLLTTRRSLMRDGYFMNAKREAERRRCRDRAED